MYTFYQLSVKINVLLFIFYLFAPPVVPGTVEDCLGTRIYLFFLIVTCFYYVCACVCVCVCGTRSTGYLILIPVLRCVLYWVI